MQTTDSRRTACARITTQLVEYEHSEPFRARSTDAQSHGTCFAVDLNGTRLLLTNAHCVEGGNGNCVLSMEHVGGPTQLRAKVRRIVPELDFAIIDCPDANLEPLHAVLEPFVSDERRDALAKGLVVQGFPLGDSSGVRTTFGCYAGTTTHHIQMSMAINQGNSGGAVTLRSNPSQVVGIATASFDNTQSMSLAIPLYHVAAAMKFAQDSEPLLRIPRLHNLWTAPLDDCGASSDVAGARVLEKWGPLQAEDVILSVHGMEVTDNGLLRIPHNFSGADINSVEVTLALPAADSVTATVQRAGVTGLLSVQLPLTLCAQNESYATLYPQWEPKGGLHYVMLNETVAIVPKSNALIEEFDVLPNDKYWLNAASAKPGASIIAWVACMSPAEHVGLEALMEITAIDGMATDTPQKLLHAISQINTSRRSNRRCHYVTLTLKGGHKYRLTITSGFIVHYY